VYIASKVAEQALEIEIYVSKEDTIEGVVFGELGHIRIGTVAQLLRYFNIPVEELNSEVGSIESILFTTIVY